MAADRPGFRALSENWRCARCGTTTPVRHYPPCLSVFVWDGVLSRTLSPMLGLLTSFHLGVPADALRAYRRGVRFVLRGLA